MKLFKLAINVVLIALIVGGILATLLYAKVRPMYEEASATAYEKLAHLSDGDFHMLHNTKIFDKNGEKIGEIDSGSYEYVKIKNISEHIQNGYIATEDTRFMEHAGINLQSITRAGLALISNDGEITQGGSTITQQVIKNNLLSQEQTFSRKLTEVLLAPAIEKKYTKADIMEFYCNSNYYGNRCYGVQTACKFYFGCSAKKVTLAQAAMLCGISNSPNRYNPVASMELATQKKEQVLANMLEQRFITQKQYDKAIKEEIKIIGVDKDSGSENYMTSYALDCATLQLMKDSGFEFKYTFADKKEQDAYNKKYEKEYSAKSAQIRGGGYKIYTSLNQRMQRKLQNAVSQNLSAFTEKNKTTKKYTLQSAAMCIDNDTQYVVAVVGGRTRADQYNRAFLSSRQPGSSIKPLLDYAPAIDNGIINGSTVMKDEKVYWDERDKESYSPKNSGGGYRGSVTMREALARSINTIAFQVFKKTGTETSLEYLDKLHFSSLSYADNWAPAISLGGFTNGVTVNDMCRGYATLQNDGKLSSRTCIVKIEHETQGVVYEAPSVEESEAQVYSADTSFIMKDMLQGTFKEGYGTAHSSYNSEQIYAGKTGTTNSSKDAWFCGFSAYYTTAVWIGYDMPKEMPGMYGGTYPLKIWTSFMNSVHSNLEKRDFEVPKTIQLAKVSGGELTKTTKEIEYTDKKSVYEQRPKGYDYFSKQNKEKKETWETDYQLENTKKAAEQAVSAFEKYKIRNAEEALALESEYNKVLAIIEEIPDEYEQSSYKKRAAKKFNSLNGSVMDKWQEAIKEYQKDQQEKMEKQRKIDAEDAAEKARETLKKNRIDKVQWYIDKINSRKYYNDTTKGLIKDSKKALKRITQYTEYEAKKKALDKAIAKAEKLPTKADSSGGSKEGDTGENENPNATQPPVPTATPMPQATPVPVN